MLRTKKTLNKLGEGMNEHLASNKVSDFAKKQMLKMGWTEGKGLGKNEDGMSSHIKISKREESVGLGSEKLNLEVQNHMDSWWSDSFAQTLQKFKETSEKKKSKKEKKTKIAKDEKKKKKKRKRDDSGVSTEFSYEELFKATNGARLGMRARADQKGKILRTEC